MNKAFDDILREASKDVFKSELKDVLKISYKEVPACGFVENYTPKRIDQHNYLISVSLPEHRYNTMISDTELLYSYDIENMIRTMLQMSEQRIRREVAEYFLHRTPVTKEATFLGMNIVIDSAVPEDVIIIHPEGFMKLIRNDIFIKR